MKNIIATSAIFALLAGAAFAANPTNERPDSFAPASTSNLTVDVTANDVYTNKELKRLNLKPTDVIAVTKIPSSGLVDATGRGN